MPNSNDVCQAILYMFKTPSKEFPNTLNFCQSGEISPNLVTLVAK